MKSDDRNIDEEMRAFEDLIQDLPLESPSRDLVAAAMAEVEGTEKPQPAGRLIQWQPLVSVAAAAAALVIIISLVARTERSIPSDADITSKLSLVSNHSKTVRANIHVVGFKKERMRLGERIKRAKNRSKKLRKSLNRIKSS